MSTPYPRTNPTSKWRSLRFLRFANCLPVGEPVDVGATLDSLPMNVVEGEDVAEEAVGDVMVCPAGITG